MRSWRVKLFNPDPADLAWRVCLFRISFYSYYRLVRAEIPFGRGLW